MKYIIAIGIFQALVAIILLLKNKLRNGADDILITLLSCMATHLLIKFVIFNFINDEHVRLQMNTFLGLCYGPLIYLYTKKLRDPKFIPNTKWFVFIPFGLAMIGYFSVMSVLVAAPQAGYPMLRWYNNLTFAAIVPSDIFYIFLSLKITKQISPEYNRELRLIKQIAYSFLLLCMVAIISYVFTALGYQVNIPVRIVSYSMFLFLCVIILRYRFLSMQSMSVNNPKAPLPQKEIENNMIVITANKNVIEEETAAKEIRKSILSNEEQARVWHQLEVQMNTSKVFKDGALNLDRLVTLTGINKYHISETLNDYAGKSFYQYINEYRIQFAIEQMKYLVEKDVPVNILSVAYDAGFNAKSSFNRYFKEITNQTPSDYLKSLQTISLNDYLDKALG